MRVKEVRELRYFYEKRGEYEAEQCGGVRRKEKIYYVIPKDGDHRELHGVDRKKKKKKNAARPKGDRCTKSRGVLKKKKKKKNKKTKKTKKTTTTKKKTKKKKKKKNTKKKNIYRERARERESK